MTIESAFAFAGVSKSFGRTRALADVSFAVPRGSVVGLIGRNGAGKSTAIRCLLGLERPDAGKVTVLGESPLHLSVAAKRRIGFMSDQGLPFPDSTAAQLFDFLAPLYPSWDHGLETELCRRFSVATSARLSELSLGQQRAVALTVALCPRPELLVLDEPAANLDAVLRREFLAEVLSLVADEGRTVLLSSHNLGDIERIADRVVLVQDGRVRLDRALEELREQVRRLRFIFPGDAPAEIAVPGMLASQRRGRELLVTVEGFDVAGLSALERTTGAHIDVAPVGLEDLFLDLADTQQAA